MGRLAFVVLDMERERKSTSPTAILREEHEVILAVIAALERAVDQGGRLGDAEFWQGAVEFIRGFADRCHHAKEEHVLFPHLERRGIPREGGPVGVMLAEHEQGRAYVRSMAESREGAAAGDDRARQTFLGAVRGYCDLLVNHIEKENGVLFPMAERVLSPTDGEELLREFSTRENEEVNPGERERLLQIAERLTQKT